MAYARYGRESKYYVFWQTSEALAKGQEVLAVLHKDHRSKKEGTEFSYDQVVRMLELGDFSAIAGFQPDDKAFLRVLLEEFICDVDTEYRTES